MVLAVDYINVACIEVMAGTQMTALVDAARVLALPVTHFTTLYLLAESFAHQSKKRHNNSILFKPKLGRVSWG